MRTVCERAVAEGIAAIAFGDLFLEDVRAYRMRQMQDTGLDLLFPVWGMDTNSLAREMIAAGLKAKITCVDPMRLAASNAGRDFDCNFVAGLPVGVDPCGENGEFHSFVYDAPVFKRPIRVRSGEVLQRDGFVLRTLFRTVESISSLPRGDNRRLALQDYPVNSAPRPEPARTDPRLGVPRQAIGTRVNAARHIAVSGRTCRARSQ